MLNDRSMHIATDLLSTANAALNPWRVEIVSAKENAAIPLPTPDKGGGNRKVAARILRNGFRPALQVVASYLVSDHLQGWAYL